VLAFAGVVSLAAVLAFGLLPAWKLSRRDPADALHGRRGGGGERATGGPGLLHTRALLVVAQCALVMVLLSGAGLLVRSYLHLRAVDPGFEPDRALLVRVGLPLPEPARRERTEADRVTAQQRQLARRVELMQAVVDRVRALPGVTRAGWIDNLLIRGEADESITIPGRPAESLAPGHLASTAVGPDLLPAVGVPLRRGRMLGPADAAAQIRLLWGPLQPAGRSLEEQARIAGAEPVVVNEAFVRRYFPGEDAVGRRFCISPTNKTYWYEIVGVVGDMHRQGLERPAIPEYFVSFVARQSADLVVRTSGDPLVLAAAVRGVVRGAERGALILEVTTVDARLGALSAQRRFHTALLSTFALLALGLAAVGIYGVVHYVVAQRTREMGVRAALGASGAAVQRLVVGEAMRLPLVGLAIGVAGAALLDRLLARLLFGVSPLDPLTHVVVAAVLSLTALGACWLPARRAARVDPVIALRED
jgi:predicted permease